MSTLISRHMLKLLLLLAGFSVAPAAARHPINSAARTAGDEACPYARERADAAARALAAMTASVPRRPTVITLTDRAPAGISLFELGRSDFVSP
jgi:hypothetical protein